MIRWLLFLLLIPSLCFGDSELTIGGRTAASHIIQVSGDSLRPRPYLDFEGCTGQDLNGKTVITCGSGGGGGGMIYPGAGIANSTGLAWGTSYGIKGNSSIIQLELGTATLDDLIMFDSNGNDIDSGVPISSIDTLTGSISANEVYASPNGSSGGASFRKLVGADLPNPSATTLGGVQSIAVVSHNFLTGITTSGVPSQAQPAQADITGLTTGSSPIFTGLNLSGLTDSQLIATDASDNLQSLSTATYPSLTELSYVKGVTSAIQTQINAKGSGTVTSIATTAPLAGGTITTTGTLTCNVASGSQAGCLASADWTTFNGKQASGNYITALTGDVTATGPGSAPASVVKVNGLAVPASKTVVGTNSSSQFVDNTSSVCLSTGAGCPTDVTGGGTFNYADNGITVTAGTYYAPIGGGGLPNATEASVDVASPTATTVANLQVGVSAAPGTGNTYVITLRDGAADKALTCTISGASATTCQDLTHSFNIAQNDLIDWKIVTTGTILGTPSIIIAASNGTSNVGVTNMSIVSANGFAGTVATSTTTPAVTISTTITGILKGNATAISAATADSDYTTPTGTETLTNKRHTPRLFTTASATTLTPEISTYDIFVETALAGNLTIANHSTSTPTAGEKMTIRLLDNGTARTIAYGTEYKARGVQLPTTTVISKYLYMLFIWNENASTWDLAAVNEE